MGIQIKEPCKEDWSGMTGTERGAFCQKCAIDVIDFTGKTAFEIKSILSQEVSKGSNTCGRMTNAQLATLNDDYYKWKNDKESFRAIWIVSLIAIFGLSLFSCQNTLSEELVSKMELEGSKIVTEVDSLDLASSNQDTILKSRDSLTNPFDINVISTNNWKLGQEWMGTVPYTEIMDIKWDFRVCEVSMGVISLLGNFTIPTEVKTFLEPIQENSSYHSILDIPFPENNSPILKTPHENFKPNTRTSNNSIIINEGNGRDFEAFIHPNPIKPSSRLFILINDSKELKIDIYKKENEELISSGKETFINGKHEADIGLYKYDKGEYILKLGSVNQKGELNFSVV